MVFVKREPEDRSKYSRHSEATTAQWVARVGHALRNLDVRSALNRSHLARLAYVERLARDLGGEPALSRACQYLILLKEGLSCQQISHELGLSREHVSRVYRRKALELLTQEFLSTIKNGR